MGLTSYEKWLKGGGAKNQPATTFKEWSKTQLPVQKASGPAQDITPKQYKS